MTSVYFNMSRIVTDSWLLPVLSRTRDCHEPCETSQHWFRAPLQIACWVSQGLNRSSCCTVMPLLSCLKAKTTTTLVPTTKYVSLDFISGHILVGYVIDSRMSVTSRALFIPYNKQRSDGPKFDLSSFTLLWLALFSYDVWVVLLMWVWVALHVDIASCTVLLTFCFDVH